MTKIRDEVTRVIKKSNSPSPVNVAIMCLIFETVAWQSVFKLSGQKLFADMLLLIVFCGICWYMFIGTGGSCRHVQQTWVFSPHLLHAVVFNFDS